MKLLYAPIHDIVLAHFRNFHSEVFQGVDTYYAPFIVTTDPYQASDILFADVHPDNNRDSLDVIPQLLSNNGSDFRYYASVIADMGYKEINWNIGCPFPAVTRKMRGSGILQDPMMIKKFLDEVSKDTHYDLSVKMRLGYDDLDDGLEVMDILNQYPIKNVIIHGRIGIQKYEGHVDLDAFETLYSKCKHEVIYNGDIYCKEDFDRFSARFPDIEQFMMGRGLLRNPNLAAEIKGINLSHADKINNIFRFHDKLFSYYEGKIDEERFFLAKLKEFWTYCHNFVDKSGDFIQKIRRTQTIEEYKTVNDAFQNMLLREM